MFKTLTDMNQAIQYAKDNNHLFIGLALESNKQLPNIILCPKNNFDNLTDFIEKYKLNITYIKSGFTIDNIIDNVFSSENKIIAVDTDKFNKDDINLYKNEYSNNPAFDNKLFNIYTIDDNKDLKDQYIELHKNYALEKFNINIDSNKNDLLSNEFNINNIFTDTISNNINSSLHNMNFYNKDYNMNLYNKDYSKDLNDKDTHNMNSYNKDYNNDLSNKDNYNNFFYNKSEKINNKENNLTYTVIPSNDSLISYDNMFYFEKNLEPDTCEISLTDNQKPSVKYKEDFSYQYQKLTKSQLIEILASLSETELKELGYQALSSNKGE